MRVTKFEHSCLLIETSGGTALIDPGEMSVPLLNLELIDKLDYILITHEHFDHLDISFINSATQKFPDVTIVSTESVVSTLSRRGIEATSQSNHDVNFFDAPHEGHVPFLVPPENVGMHLFGSISLPGDSHSFRETKDILALPVTAPWGSTDRAVQLALELKPKHIIPIHDWHWKEEVRGSMYQRLEKLFAESDILFHKMKNDTSVEIEELADYTG